MTTVAKKQADGTYKLSGQKTWVTMGEKLPYTIVVAKDEDPSHDNGNMSLWFVKMTPPASSTAPLHKIGQQCIPFCEVYLDDVVLTEDQRMGEPGKGLHDAHEELRGRAFLHRSPSRSAWLRQLSRTPPSTLTSVSPSASRSRACR